MKDDCYFKGETPGKRVGRFLKENKRIILFVVAGSLFLFLVNQHFMKTKVYNLFQVLSGKVSQLPKFPSQFLVVNGIGLDEVSPAVEKTALFQNLHLQPYFCPLYSVQLSPIEEAKSLWLCNVYFEPPTYILLPLEKLPPTKPIGAMGNSPFMWKICIFCGKSCLYFGVYAAVRPVLPDRFVYNVVNFIYKRKRTPLPWLRF